MWNLLPVTDRVNLDKKDKISSLACIESCRPAIVHYWGLLREAYPERFDREVALSLTGAEVAGSTDWEEGAIRCLEEKVPVSRRRPGIRFIAISRIRRCLNVFKQIHDTVKVDKNDDLTRRENDCLSSKKSISD